MKGSVTSGDGFSGRLSNVWTCLEETANAFAALSETRDPYTSGHQRRVADLACSIARHMNLGADLLAGLRIAGIMHDIGKISAPADILSKPGRLTAPEYDIVKRHAGVACSFLAPVTFPWPLGLIIGQHHERLDGSGYPDGIGGDDIRLEARIIAVADVVEAMSARRSYRLALGIDAALAEIEKNAGRLYDRTVVQACLQLFREGGFEFSAR